MPVSFEELREMFRARLRATRCPECALAYTEWSVGWCEGWLEGRRQALEECGLSERDGEFQIVCELCGCVSALDTFRFSPRVLTRGER